MKQVLLPETIPTPKFYFWQKVEWMSTYNQRFFGEIRGLECWTPQMSLKEVEHLDWVGWWYKIEIDRAFTDTDYGPIDGIATIHEEDLELKTVEVQYAN
ncbi:MAG TPA: hypothetical protein V6C57_29625 [Coleofasciculaceae cyanobacterium]